MTNTNIKIQNVQSDSITLEVNGEMQRISNKLDALQALLEQQGSKTFQTADKIYNIGTINEANFGFVVGKKAFNEHLTKTVINAIRVHSSNADRFLKMMQSKKEIEWEKNKTYRNPAKKIIADSFVGIIGVGLSQLMAIGDEKAGQQMDYDKENAYIEKCVHIVAYSLALVNFTLLSELWEQQKKAENYLLDDTTQSAILARLTNNFPPSLPERLALLRTLHAVFEQLQLPFPIKELKDFTPQLAKNSAFEQLIQDFQQIKAKLDQGQYDLLNCFEAEQQLARFLTHFVFLTNYNMASIKRIGYRQLRHDDPAYFHRYNALGIDLKSNVDAEKGLYTPSTVHTNAVLFYEGEDYNKNVNLFPFIIDYNSLTLEQGTQIGFFQSLDFEDSSLNYFILMKDELENIALQGVFDKEKGDLGTLLLNQEQHKTFNLDCVVESFEQAKRDLLSSDDLKLENW